jgi:hypothetical protein
MLNKAAGHAATLLSNGKVLVVGGGNCASEIFDPATGNWSAAGGKRLTGWQGARQYFTATIFRGSVIEAGGLNGSTRLASMELYQGSSFQSGGNMTGPRAAHTATVLNDGSVLLTGGQGISGISVATAELLK